MAVITGKLTNVNDPSQGIPDAAVTATDKSDSSNQGRASTGRTGEYKISQLAVGTYTVEVKAPDGFQNPGSKEVTLAAENSSESADFELAPTVTAPTAAQTGSISGQVTNEKPGPVEGAKVTATNAQDPNIAGEATTNGGGKYTIANLPVGAYTVKVTSPPPPGYQYLPARNVVVNAGATTQGIDFSLDVVEHFRGILDDARFSIETLISTFEANQAVSLFSVSNLMLAGLSRRRVGSEEKVDMLGVLNLYYGLQDNSLTTQLVVQNSDRLWRSIEPDLKDLAEDLDQLQSDVEFLNQEAKRQFNLGTSTGVVGNAQFPTLFNRYVEIGTDALLSIDIRAEDKPNSFFDKEKLEKAYDLLRDLKGVILQIVRSLSKYGTAATRRVNEDWSEFESRALEVLATVAQERVSPDQDDKNPWAVLAVLTGKHRETEIAPYVVLARHGGKLLQTAMDVYLKSEDQLDNFDRDHLLDLFQPQGQEFLTTRIRREATVIKRYPLANWG